MDGSTRSQRTEHLADVVTWGLRFTDAASVEHVSDALFDGFRGKPGELPLVVTPNVDILVTLEDAEAVVRDSVDRAAIVLADGQPLVSFSHLAGGKLGAKLAGSDLTSVMWPRLALEGRSMFAVVSSATIGERLDRKHPDCRWIEAPMLTAEEGSVIDTFAWSCVQSILTSAKRPDFIFVGIGFSKDVLVARSIIDQWPTDQGEVPVVLAVGASLAFLTGEKKRAPKIFQLLGIEFVHRMLSEPKRLLKRYLVKDLRFLLILWRHLST
jgi:N-acetylglucosaminyldiphosphoundecaprenol N-acetyl-beta-D-mannosaminyltransferase